MDIQDRWSLEMGYDSFEEWSLRVKRINKLLKTDEITNWWKINYDKLHDDSLMPDYTVNEKLPISDNPASKFEQLRPCLRDVDIYMWEYSENSYDLIMDLYWDRESLLTTEDKKLIDLYFDSGKSIKDISIELQKSKSSLYEQLIKLKDKAVSLLNGRNYGRKTKDC